MKKLLVLLTLLLSGCGSDEVVNSLGTQMWNDVSISVEARTASNSDFYEFLVIATIGRNKPAHNLFVHVRVNEDDAWKQSIQDGMVGVYRRAIKVAHPDKDVLFIQLRRGEEQGELRFPLNLPPRKV